MQSSHFVKKLVALKEASTLQKPSSSPSKLQRNTERDLTNLSYLGRLFDDLPRELVDEKFLNGLESDYLALFESDTFPKEQTDLLRDKMLLQAYHDLLGQSGELDTHLVTQLNLQKPIEKNSEQLSKATLMKAYINFISSFLVKIKNNATQTREDIGFIKEFASAVPRTMIVMRRLDQYQDYHVERYLMTACIAHSLKSMTVSSLSCSQLTENIAVECRTPSPLRKHQVVHFWVDVMYIAKEIADYNSVVAINAGLKRAGIYSYHVIDKTMCGKYKLCEVLAKFHKPKYLTTLKKEKTVDAFFSKDKDYQKFIIQLLKLVSEKIEKEYEIIKNELAIIHDLIMRLRSETPPEPASIALSVYALFKPTDPFEALHAVFLQDTALISDVDKKTKNALDSLHKRLPKNDGKSTVTQAIKSTLVIDEACASLKECGQTSIPGLIYKSVIKSPTLYNDSTSVNSASVIARKAKPF